MWEEQTSSELDDMDEVVVPDAIPPGRCVMPQGRGAIPRGRSVVQAPDAEASPAARVASRVASTYDWDLD